MERSTEVVRHLHFFQDKKSEIASGDLKLGCLIWAEARELGNVTNFLAFIATNSIMRVEIYQFAVDTAGLCS